MHLLYQLGIINIKSELVDPDSVVKQLSILKSINVDGVMVDCWWGIVEAHAPKEYNWDGYKRLFQIVCELKLKIQVMFIFVIYIHSISLLYFFLLRWVAQPNSFLV